MSERVSKPAGALEGVRLRDEDAALQATFHPDTGMLCSSLRERGVELLAQNAGVEAYARSGKTMGIPLLYPWANRLSGFDYNIAGRTVSVPHDPARVSVEQNGLPIHGLIGGRMAWELTRCDQDSLSARLDWSEDRQESFELFPFHHEVDYEARLTDGRLWVEIDVYACGSDTVPVSFGFHPYLAPSEVEREQWLIELPAMRHLAFDAHQIPLGAGQATPARSFRLAENEFDDGFDGLTAPARFSVTAGERRIELEFLHGYPCAQVYAPPGRRFVCFEPMTAPTNALRSGAGLRLLAPGERLRAGFALSILHVPPHERP